ncbi:MAG: DUF3592 domain-containing protein [Chitinophagales bacterium]
MAVYWLIGSSILAIIVFGKDSVISFKLLRRGIRVLATVTSNEKVDRYYFDGKSIGVHTYDLVQYYYTARNGEVYKHESVPLFSFGTFGVKPGRNLEVVYLEETPQDAQLWNKPLLLWPIIWLLGAIITAATCLAYMFYHGTF